MALVNHTELPDQINHKQGLGSNCRDSRLRGRSSDSGTGSADTEDDFYQNGETDAQCSSGRNQFSGYEMTNHISSEFFNGVKQSVKRIERQDHVDIPLIQDKGKNVLQTAPVIPSQDSQNHGENVRQTAPMRTFCDSHVQDHGKNVLQTSPAIPSFNPQALTGNFSHTPQLSYSCRSDGSEKPGWKFSSHSAGTLESSPEGVNFHEGTSKNNQNNNKMTVKEDTSKNNHNNNKLTVKEDTSKNNQNNNTLTVTEKDNIQMLEHELQSRASSSELENNKISHSQLAVKENDNIQRLEHESQSRASSSEQCNTFWEDSEIFATGPEKDGILRCLSAPASSAKLSHQPSESTSLLVSPIDLVPKHVMENLGRELNRERGLVKRLQLENDHLRTTVAQIKGRYQAFAAHCMEELNLRQQNISCLQTITETWQRKFNEKDKDLKSTWQHLNVSNEKYKELQSQMNTLSARLLKEESKNKTLNDNYSNLERTLQKETVRFDRDDKCLKEKIEEMKKQIEELKKTVGWLSEELDEHVDSPVYVTKHRRDLRASVRSLTETESGVPQSNETQLKSIYLEKTLCQAQMTFPKLKPKKSSNSEAQEIHYTSPKRECTIASSQETKLPDVKKCSHCYKEETEFKSYKEFMDHIDKCEQ